MRHSDTSIQFIRGHSFGMMHVLFQSHGGKHMSTTKGSYIYLSGWMIAALRSEFGPLPDQSMHEKTTVPELIKELYTFLRQADSRELNGLFRDLDAARAAGIATGAQEWHPMQEAFQQCHALQCGFCTPGMIMTSVDMVNRYKAEGKELTTDAIRNELEGNICRCTGYHNIVKSVLAAAQAK